MTKINTHEINEYLLAEAAFAARDYHGGQGCPLYALASTGSVTDGLSGALLRACRTAENQGDIEAAETLGALYNALP